MISDFKLDLARAITEQLVEQFNKIDPSPLTDDALELAKAEPGVYQLFLDGEIVYVGKSDTDVSDRLRRHLRVLQARRKSLLPRLTCKVMYLDKNWVPYSTKARLISRLDFKSQQFTALNPDFSRVRAGC